MYWERIQSHFLKMHGDYFNSESCYWIFLPYNIFSLDLGPSLQLTRKDHKDRYIFDKVAVDSI